MCTAGLLIAMQFSCITLQITLCEWVRSPRDDTYFIALAQQNLFKILPPYFLYQPRGLCPMCTFLPCVIQ